MNLYKKTAAIILFCFTGIFSFAQTQASPALKQTDFMNSNGKIFVVVAVILVILIGLFIYLFNLDNKISKLEKKDK